MSDHPQSFSLFNINIMHGRNSKSAIFPPYKKSSIIKQNLQKIVLCIQKYNPDIVTIQEIDRFSILSGRFNQVDYLKEKLKYPYVYFGPSCSIKILGKDMFVSGNAIFSKFPMNNQENVLFDITFPTDRMGFVKVDVDIPEKGPVSIYTVHLVYLDWLHKNERERELRVLSNHLHKSSIQAVVAGDFNCDFTGKEDSLRNFSIENELIAFDYKNKCHLTYPSWLLQTRIDWILLPKNLSFISHETVTEKIPDHCAIYAKISL